MCRLSFGKLKLKEIISFLVVLFVSFYCLWGEEKKVIDTNEPTFLTLENKMNDYTEEKEFQWSFNPFKKPYTDRFFSPWTDPLAYNSYWYMYYPHNVEKYYDRTKFKLDKVLFYHSPQVGATVTPICFAFDNMKYRFNIGVAFMWSGYFLMYGNGGTQLYGTHLFLNSLFQIEPFFDFIYKDKLKIRLTPIRHICYHMAGDILGDESLHILENNHPDNKNGEKFKDVGFEQVHLSANYRWGWVNFYGGGAFAVNNFTQSTYLNVAYFYTGAEMKLPIVGDLKLIAGIHVGGNYDKLCDIQHVIEGNTYKCVNNRYELTPIISAGVGFGIYDWIIGLKFDYGRSRQIYAIDYMENRIGLSACLML